MRIPSVGIIDLGIGNHHSVKKACQSVGAKVFISYDYHILDRCDFLILPGVGSFPHAFHALCARSLDSFILSAHNDSRHILGICLGMQLLAEYSEEDTLTHGLSIFSGGVHAFPHRSIHVGWNSVTSEDNPTCKSLSFKNDSYFYFNHSFFLSPSSPNISHSSFFNQDFPAIVQNGNTIGIQFHPEKSQSDGRALLTFLIYRSIA